MSSILSIIPIPQEVTPTDGSFHLIHDTRVIFNQPQVAQVAQQFAARLSELAGVRYEAAQAASTGKDTREIVLTIVDTDSQLGPEGYRLEVSPQRVTIDAAGEAGLFYGIQTFLQLLPVDSYAIPGVKILDYPRFPWRGAMLDVSRHFFTVDEIKRFLDAMAFHKLNIFHWHLTDDGGWRIQMKKYPRLTEIGAWRDGIGFDLDPASSAAYDSRGRYGGYYTQDEIRDVVAYAKARHITVIPEIELPGHATAALLSYPEYSCAGAPPKMQSFAGLVKEAYCPGNDETFRFLQDVLDEVVTLFPASYIHIGGDECSKERWKECPKCQARIQSEKLKDEFELQSYFIKRIECYLNGLGKKLIGWDEILEGGLAPNATVLSWRGTTGGVAAAKAGHDVVMSPTSHCYLDFRQAQDVASEPKAIGNTVLTLETTYAYEPIPDELIGDERDRVLGAQGNVWTEFIANPRHMEYMSFPRLSALAEVAWSQPQRKDYADFRRRMQRMETWLAGMNVSYRPLATDRAR